MGRKCRYTATANEQFQQYKYVCRIIEIIMYLLLLYKNMETNYVLCITFYHTVVKMSRYAEADFSVFRLKNAFSDGYNIRFFHKKQHQPFAVIEINYERIINPPRYLFCFFFLHKQLSFRKKFGGSGIDLLDKK